MKMGLPDESGRPRPVPVEDSEFSTEYDAVITAIGETADTSVIPQELLDQSGNLSTNNERYFLGKNVFAGGDFITGPGTVIAAITAGKNAAAAIELFYQARALQAISEKVNVQIVGRISTTNILKRRHARHNRNCRRGENDTPVS